MWVLFSFNPLAKLTNEEYLKLLFSFIVFGVGIRQFVVSRNLKKIILNKPK
jgi:hypothetical protein